jgi:hypothetical protein
MLSRSSLFRAVALAAALAAAVPGCRREPRVAPDDIKDGAATLTPSPGPTANGQQPTASPVADLVPPAPSGWVPGTEFHAPPPIDVPNVPPESGFNMLTNPGFEDAAQGSTAPWWYFPDRPHWGGFTISSAQTLTGRWAARLDLLVDEQHPPPDKAHIRGVIQDIRSPVFPTRISGNYYVERWEKGTIDQYMQFVVIAAGAAMSGGSVQNTQIRYLLAGIDHPPFGIANAKFFYVTKTEPEVGKWVHFERNLVQDFTELWGSVPETFQNVRVLFEVRYDNVDVNNPPRLHAVVYFDDLYLGT